MAAKTMNSKKAYINKLNAVLQRASADTVKEVYRAAMEIIDDAEPYKPQK